MHTEHAEHPDEHRLPRMTCSLVVRVLVFIEILLTAASGRENSDQQNIIIINITVIIPIILITGCGQTGGEGGGDRLCLCR